MEFPRQEYWSGMPFPTPGNLPDPGIEPLPLASPSSKGSLSLEPPGKPLFHFRWDYCKLSENLQVNWLVAVPPCGAEESFGSEGMPWH